MKQKFVITVSIIPYKETGKLLVTERSTKEMQGSGMLSYCGGKIDDFKVGQDKSAIHAILEKTALRELKEEAGVFIDTNSLCLINNHAFERLDNDFSLMIVFIAKFKKQKKVELDPEEIKALHWLKFEEIDKDKMYKSVYQVYAEADKYLKTLRLAQST